MRQATAVVAAGFWKGFSHPHTASTPLHTHPSRSQPTPLHTHAPYTVPTTQHTHTAPTARTLTSLRTPQATEDGAARIRKGLPSDTYYCAGMPTPTVHCVACCTVLFHHTTQSQYNHCVKLHRTVMSLYCPALQSAVLCVHSTRYLEGCLFVAIPKPVIHGQHLSLPADTVVCCCYAGVWCEYSAACRGYWTGAVTSMDRSHTSHSSLSYDALCV
jgi:hypothetical protein